MTPEEAKERLVEQCRAIDRDFRRGFARRKWAYLGGALLAGVGLSLCLGRARASGRRRRRCRC